jgi:hypothetical protein
VADEPEHEVIEVGDDLKFCGHGERAYFKKNFLLPPEAGGRRIKG